MYMEDNIRITNASQISDPQKDTENTSELTDSAAMKRVPTNVFRRGAHDKQLPKERKRRWFRLQRGYTLPTNDVDELSWFPHWLKTQIAEQPGWVFYAIVDQDFDEQNHDDEALLKSVRKLLHDVWRVCEGFQQGKIEYQSPDKGRDDEAIYSEALYFMRMLFCPEDSHSDTAEEIKARYNRKPARTPLTIRNITEQLIKEGRLRKGRLILHRWYWDWLSRESSNAEAEGLVFALLGWGTMLYCPMHPVLPPENSHFRISLTHRNGCQGQIHTKLESGDSPITRSLPNLLASFGPLIPDATDWHSGDNLLEGDKTVASSSFNAHLLSIIGGVNFKWTDCLPCHLDYDTETKTVYLFQYPSFCQQSLKVLPEHRTILSKDSTKLIFNCAATSNDDLGQARFGTSEQLESMLREVLRSYRLLFGQNKASRKFFLEIYPFKDNLAEERDDTLMKLCGPQSAISSSLARNEEYILSTHFPVLGSRLVPLLRRLSSKRPQTWKQLWKDKRDSASRYTFWAVIIIGGIGIILAFLQLVLQAVALGLQHH